MVKAAQVVFVRLTPNFFLVLPTPIHTIYLENEVIVECLERSGLMDHPNNHEIRFFQRFFKPFTVKFKKPQLCVFLRFAHYFEASLK